MVPEPVDTEDSIKDELTEALKTSFYIGITPDIFWLMTPWQFGVCCKAYNEKSEFRHNQDAYMMWNNAMLSRWGGKKKFPSLDQFTTGSKKQVKAIDEAAIINALKFHNSALKE